MIAKALLVMASIATYPHTPTPMSDVEFIAKCEAIVNRYPDYTSHAHAMCIDALAEGKTLKFEWSLKKPDPRQ